MELFPMFPSLFRKDSPTSQKCKFDLSWNHIDQPMSDRSTLENPDIRDIGMLQTGEEVAPPEAKASQI
jgi:hypothetical protein